jgi:hypothetical protein
MAGQIDAIQRWPCRGRVVVIDVLEIAEPAVVDEHDDVAGRLDADGPNSSFCRQKTPGQPLGRRSIVCYFEVDGGAAALAATHSHRRRSLNPKSFDPREVSAQDQIKNRALVSLQRPRLMRLHVPDY